MRLFAKHRPSPALVISLIALFFAVGGSAYGLVITGKSIKNNTVRGVDIKNRSLTGRDVKRGSLGSGAVKESSFGTVPRAGGAGTAEGSARHIVMTAAGVTARQRGVTSAVRTAAGRYQVIFNRDVRGCAYVGNIGDAGAATPPEGMFSVSSLGSNVAGVAVKTLNDQGAPENRPFHLVVSC